VVTSGEMRIGWTTKRMQPSERENLGSNDQSVAFDGYNRCIWHEDKSYELPKTIPQWKADDIVGCQIDRLTPKFAFYLNGQSIIPNEPLNAHFSRSQSYFGAVSLTAYQQCVFNFGATAFRHHPSRASCFNFTEIQRHDQIARERAREQQPISVANNAQLHYVSINVNSTNTHLGHFNIGGSNVNQNGVDPS